MRKKYLYKYSFNKKTGLIEYKTNNNNNFNNIITSISHNDLFNFKEIYMITENNGQIKFDINNIIIDNNEQNISYIDNKPIHYVLIMVYLISKKNKTLIYPELSDDKKYDETCREIFGPNYNTDICAKYFYSVIGKNYISVIKNFKENNYIIESPKTLYMILKNLNWKKNKDKIISVDKWLELLNNDKLRLYLQKNNNLHIFLTNIVNKLNTIKYNYE